MVEEEIEKIVLNEIKSFIIGFGLWFFSDVFWNELIWNFIKFLVEF